MILCKTYIKNNGNLQCQDVILVLSGEVTVSVVFFISSLTAKSNTVYRGRQENSSIVKHKFTMFKVAGLIPRSPALGRAASEQKSKISTCPLTSLSQVLTLTFHG